MEVGVEVVFGLFTQSLTGQSLLLIFKEVKVGTVVVESSDITSL